MTTGYDARIHISIEEESRRALDEIVPDELSRAEVLRRQIDSLIDEGREGIEDELLRTIDRKRAERETNERVKTGLLLKRTKNLAKKIQGDDTPMPYVEYMFARRYEEARNLPDKLMPEKAVEYVDCVMTLTRAYDYDEERARQNKTNEGAPIGFKNAIQQMYRSFPDGHKQRTAEIIDAVELPEEEIRRLHEATENGLLDDFVDDGYINVSSDMSGKEREIVRKTKERAGDSRRIRQRKNIEGEGTEGENPLIFLESGKIRRLQDVADKIDMSEIEKIPTHSRDEIREIVEGNREPMTDGGIDTRDAYEHATDERQQDIREAPDDATNEDDDDASETTVRARLNEELVGDIHAVQATHRTENAIYLLVARSAEWSEIEDSGQDIPVLDLRTVVVDLKDGGRIAGVRVSDNGVWFPRSETVAGNVAQMFARASSSVSGAVDDGDVEDALVLDGCPEEVDAEMLLDAGVEVERETEGQAAHKMESHPGISPSRDWGYGGGPPPEAYELARRMREAGLEPSEHFVRLWFGQKKPHGSERSNLEPDDELRPAAELKGNYGVEVRQRDSGLVLVDVDDPEAFEALDAGVPESYSVSSPHGDDARRHIYLVCEDKGMVADELGGWSAYQDWGELYVGNPFVVGPGSQLSAYGCDRDSYERGESDACEACSEEDDGYYSVVEDAPIESVSADTLLALVETGGENDEETDESDAETNDSVVRCDSCGAAYPEEEADDYLKDAGPVRVCEGGCE